MELLNQFKKKYGDWINPNLLSMIIDKSSEKVYVVMTFQESSDEQKVTRIDLDFISGTNTDLLFDLGYPIEINAARVQRLDSYSLIMCIDGLFTKAAIEKILNKEYNSISQKINDLYNSWYEQKYSPDEGEFIFGQEPINLPEGFNIDEIREIDNLRKLMIRSLEARKENDLASHLKLHQEIMDNYFEEYLFLEYFEFLNETR